MEHPSPAARARLIALIVLALMAFAGNSLLCRAALRDNAIDPACFTLIRLFAGAGMLWLLVACRRPRPADSPASANWLSALSLFTYAAAFSFAYLELSAATGALVLFAAVQITMIGHAVRAGERLAGVRLLGVALAFAGVLFLLLPGLTAPPLRAALLMAVAGIAWGVYSVRGRGTGDALQTTAGNFLRTLPMALCLSLITTTPWPMQMSGILLALASGALGSGVGYAIWYSVLPSLRGSTASILQLAVPIIAAGGGIAVLSEPITVRFLVASAAVLGGIALVIQRSRQ